MNPNNVLEWLKDFFDRIEVSYERNEATISFKCYKSNLLAGEVYCINTFDIENNDNWYFYKNGNTIKINSRMELIQAIIKLENV